MALGIGKPKKQQPPPEEDSQEEYDAAADDAAMVDYSFQRQGGGIRTDFEQQEWFFEPTTFITAQKSIGLVKEMAMSKLDTDKDKEMAQILFDILLCAMMDFPVERKYVKTCWAEFMGFLLLHCSDKGWARELARTQRAIMERRAEERPVKPKKGF
jgi:hypothetical protein